MFYKETQFFENTEGNIDIETDKIGQLGCNTLKVTECLGTTDKRF